MPERLLSFELTQNDTQRMYMLGQFLRKVNFDESGCRLWTANLRQTPKQRVCRACQVLKQIERYWARKKGIQ
jgi:hypothetical protein